MTQPSPKIPYSKPRGPHGLESGPLRKP